MTVANTVSHTTRLIHPSPSCNNDGGNGGGCDVDADADADADAGTVIASKASTVSWLNTIQPHESDPALQVKYPHDFFSFLELI